MRILGIDPGLSATGYGVLEDGIPVEYGTVTTSTNVSLPERLRQLGTDLRRVVRRTRPESCALETLFFKAGGARSVIRSAEARGTIIYTLACAGVAVTELTPATIKLAVTGSGRASKGQMNYMVKALLGLDERVPEHAADALAAAYCLHRRSASLARLKPATRGGRR